MAAFLIWAGRSAVDSVNVGRPEALWAGLVLLSLLAVGSFTRPNVRRRTGKAFRNARSLARVGLSQLADAPSKVAATVAAAVVVALANVAALDVATSIFEPELPLATVAVVLLAASLIASLVPTPGHLGGTEVALIAGLVAW